MKYVVVEEMGIEVPIIFSELQKHTDIAGNKKVIAAGFCRFCGDVVLGEDANGSEDKTVAGVACWGESLGLKIKSRGNIDADLIMKHNEFRA